MDADKKKRTNIMLTMNDRELETVDKGMVKNNFTHRATFVKWVLNMF